jgi:hypothetical protein
LPGVSHNSFLNVVHNVVHVDIDSVTIGLFLEPLSNILIILANFSFVFIEFSHSSLLPHQLSIHKSKFAKSIFLSKPSLFLSPLLRFINLNISSRAGNRLESIPILSRKLRDFLTFSSHSNNSFLASYIFSYIAFSNTSFTFLNLPFSISIAELFSFISFIFVSINF